MMSARSARMSARMSATAGTRRPLSSILWPLASAGNCTALAVVAIVLASWPSLVREDGRASTAGPGTLAAPTPLPPAGDRADRVLLVVIDALREDTAKDEAVMPNLARLARDGGRGIAMVESAVPSTVAGIRAIATGAVPAPASFLEDFGARPENDGGLFEIVRESGGRSFVAGSSLWTDLYGAWIDEAFVVSTVHESDAEVLDAATEALRDGAFDLVVVHLGRCDDLAHRFGATSEEYREGARWCDVALGELVDVAPPGTAVLVTSDHGVTESGGHAGPEPIVRRTPLVTHGPGMTRGAIGELPQRAVARLATGALGLPAIDRPSAGAGRALESRSSGTLALLMAAAPALLAALVFLALGHAGIVRRWQPSLLDAVLWIALGLILLSAPALALLVVTAALAIAVAGTRRLPRLIDTRSVVLAALAGVFLAIGRLADGRGTLEEAATTVPVALAAGVVAIAGLALARVLSARPTIAISPAFAGVMLIVAATGLGRLTGDTLSLSSVDVSTAFTLVDGPGGLPLAVAVVMLRHALPALAVLVGFVPFLRRRDSRPGAFFAAAGAALVGEAVVFGGALALAGDDVVDLSLAVSGLARVVCEMTFVFLGATFLLAATAALTGVTSYLVPSSSSSSSSKPLPFKKQTAQTATASASTPGTAPRASPRAGAPPPPCGD